MFGARQRLRDSDQGACPCGQERPSLSLWDVATGQPVRVLRIHCRNACGARLRELGIVEGAVIELVQRADPLLLYAKDTRIGLDPRTASQIEVEYAGSDSQVA
jgi:Fe2+ transport system protein FeoA